jgi:hypothetical protein
MIGRWLLHILIIAPVASSIALSPPTERTGSAPYYGPTAMKTVMENRGLPFFPCTGASPHHEIGAVVDVTGHRTGRTLRCKVYDVPQSYDWQALVDRGVVWRPIIIAHASSAARRTNARRSRATAK